MAVTINAGDRMVTAGTFGAVQDLTQSTATTLRFISAHVPVSTLAGGTVTGATIDRYLVYGTGTATDGISGPAVEGMEKFILMLATGEAKVQFQSMATGRVHGIPEMGTGTATQLGIYIAASATGAFVLNAVGDYIKAIFANQTWYVYAGNATYGTATLTA